MKNRNFIRRAAAVALAGAMMATMGMGALAAGVTSGNGVGEVTVTKTILTDGNTYAPNTTFTINAVPSTDTTKYDGNVVYAGVAGGLTGTTLTSTPGSATNSSYTLEGSLTVSNVFDTPGVYHYVVTETAESYEGMTYDSSSYDVYLYVYNGESGLYVGNVVSTKGGTKNDLSFTNNYGGEGNDSTHDVTVTKKIEGDQANMSQKFEFTVSVADENGQGNGERYKVVTPEGITSVDSGSSITVKLGNNDSVTIYGLSASDVYKIVESANSDGYTVTDTQTNTAEGTVSGTAMTDDESYTVTNTKNAVTPTGLVMNIAPYILMVAAAAALALVFLRKRNYNAD